MRADEASARNAELVAFLRFRMTPDEQQWPRFESVLRAVSAVSIGELRVHPDLLERLGELDPPDGRTRLRMLMGSAVLVAATGVAYAFAYSQTFLAARLSPGLDPELAASVRLPSHPTDANDARGRQQPERIRTLGADWTLLDPWRAPLAHLQRVIAAARHSAERII